MNNNGNILEWFQNLMPYRWHIRLAISVGVLSLVLLLSTSAKQIQILVDIFQEKPIPTESTQTVEEKIKPTISIASARNLFGRYQPKASVALSTDLQLNGIIMSDNPADRFAIIAEKGKSEDIFGLGDKITEGVILKEIYSDRIIILRNGQRETLPLILESGVSTGLQRPKPSTLTRPRSKKTTQERLQEIRERYQKPRQ